MSGPRARHIPDRLWNVVAFVLVGITPLGCGNGTSAFSQEDTARSGADGKDTSGASSPGNAGAQSSPTTDGNHGGQQGAAGSRENGSSQAGGGGAQGRAGAGGAGGAGASPMGAGGLLGQGTGGSWPTGVAGQGGKAGGTTNPRGGAGAAAAGAGGRTSRGNSGAGGATDEGNSATAGNMLGAGGRTGPGNSRGGGSGTGGQALGRGGGTTGTGGIANSGALSNLTIWIAGDSTVANGQTPCPVGWGAQLAPYFNNKVTVRNGAAGGRSVRTWLYDVQSTMDTAGECVLETDSTGQPTITAAWKTTLDGMKPGDYLLIQFGINDGSSSCPRHVGLEAFKTSYAMMAQAAKDRGAHPVFLTPVSAIACNGTAARGTRGSYVTATQEVGTKSDVPVIDLHDRSVALYNALKFCPIPGGGDVSSTTTGPVGEFFCEDHTHFDRGGATEIAKLIAEALREQNIELAAYLQD